MSAPWRAFLDGVKGFVARRVPAADADDVAQEVFLRLHRGADGLRDAARAQAWAYTIARRTVADYYRRRAAPSEEALLEPDAAVGDTYDPLAHEQVLSWIRPMAESLPEIYRDALLLADFEGHTQAEVAARLGLSLSGAKSRVQRARALLAERLHDCCAFELDDTGRVTSYEQRRGECSSCR